jgi:hypothetical protein
VLTGPEQSWRNSQVHFINQPSSMPVSPPSRPCMRWNVRLVTSQS